MYTLFYAVAVKEAADHVARINLLRLRIAILRPDIAEEVKQWDDLGVLEDTYACVAAGLPTMRKPGYIPYWYLQLRMEYIKSCQPPISLDSIRPLLLPGTRSATRKVATEQGVYYRGSCAGRKDWTLSRRSSRAF